LSSSIVNTRPGKVLRFGLRLPIWLYRTRFGWMLGDRFLLLTHTGRKSGLPRQTVIEVVQHDKTSDTYYVVSGWGEKSDWYRNIRKDPSVVIQTGRRTFRSTTEFVPEDKAVEIVQAYALDHPVAFNELSRLFLGERLKLDSGAPKRLAEIMPMVAFTPETFA